jgi:hypothetical protein
MARYLPEGLRRVVDKSLVIGADRFMLDTGQNSDFVERVVLFLVGKLDHFDFLESVGLLIE